MSKTANFGSEGPNFPGAGSGEEARLFHDIVRKHHPWPAGVRNVGLRFGEDSAGAPAVWLVFFTKDDLNPTDESISAIRRVADEVRSEIFRTGSERWPYITIEAE